MKTMDLDEFFYISVIISEFQARLDDDDSIYTSGITEG